jgi:hypothetical protein
LIVLAKASRRFSAVGRARRAMFWLKMSGGMANGTQAFDIARFADADTVPGALESRT